MKVVATRLYRRGRSGFTLIELMVVVAIIAVLIGIMLPAYSGMKQKALMKRAEADARALASAIRAYHTEFSEWPYNPAGGGLWYTTNGFFVKLTSAGNGRRNFSEWDQGNQLLGDPFRSRSSTVPTTQPYRVQISVTDNYVRVWSCGMNCVDDNGIADSSTSPPKDYIQVKN